MHTTRIWAVTIALGGMLALAGCSSDPPANEPTADASPVADASPSTSPTPTESEEPEASAYAPCPDALVDALNAASSGSTSWEIGTWADVPFGAEIDAPVPSCTAIRGPSWSQSFYVGGDQALWDQLAASIAATGMPPYNSEFETPGSAAWGTPETGFVSVTMITAGDTSMILGSTFTEQTVVLDVNGVS